MANIETEKNKERYIELINEENIKLADDCLNPINWPEGFEEAKTVSESIIAQASKLSEIIKGLDFSMVPIETMNVVISHLQSFSLHYNNLRKYLTDNNALDYLKDKANVDRHIQNFSASLHHLYSMAASIKAENRLFSCQPLEFDINQTQKYLRESKKEVDDIVSELKKSMGETGIPKYGGIFKKQSERHKIVAIGWLFATITVAITIGVLGIFLWLGPKYPLNINNSTDKAVSVATKIEKKKENIKTDPKAKADMNSMIQSMSGKIIVFSTLFFLLVWFSRNYNANRHNYIVNKHRQNALITFDSFVENAGDDQDTKNAVLLQATQTIFSALPSGYHKESPGSDDKFYSLFASLLGSSKK